MTTTPIPNTESTSRFDDLGIAPKLLDILQRLKFTIPTPIQSQAIPSAIAGKDVMGIAQTGTGKTLAFGIPMIQRLAQSGGMGKAQSKGLIVLPTRELAVQVNESLKKIGGPLGLKTAILIGGEPMGKQLRALRLNPHIYIATPGRLIDHVESKTLSLNNANIVVLDEADRMLDMGFAPQIKKVLQALPANRQTMLFSATMPEAIVSIAQSYMNTPLRIEVAPAGTSGAGVTQEIYFIDRKEKPALLKNLLNKYNGSVLVFSRTKFGAKKIAAIVRKFDITATEIHSNRSLNQRLDALRGFSLGKFRVLIATDIAARGIDVSGIQLVINYDLPDNAEDYVHRIGRTGRAGQTGHAISFATHDQKRDIATIERLIRKTLPVAKSPLSAADRAEAAEMNAAMRDDRPPLERGGRGGSRGGFSGRGSRDSRTGDSRGPRSYSSGRSSAPSSSRPSSGRPDSRPATGRPANGRPSFGAGPRSPRSTGSGFDRASAPASNRPADNRRTYGGRSNDRSNDRSASSAERPSTPGEYKRKPSFGDRKKAGGSRHARPPFQKNLDDFKWGKF